MIVRNEAHQLAECLRPVAELFDEIIIVDTGSTDHTLEIAGQFTSKVYRFPWCDDFSAARNESLRHATGDWVFWLDADDRVSAENIAKLGKCFSQLGDQPQTYLMNTACSSKFACEGVSLITHTRLFRRHPQLCWRGRVHEQLRPEAATLGHQPVWSDVRIDHTGYEDQGLQHRKLQRDLRLLRMDYATDPDDASTLIHLGLTHYHLGRFAPARTYLNRLLSLSTEPSDYLRQVFGVLASMSMREGRLSEALATLDRAVATFPNADDLLYAKAECLYELDRYDESADSLVRIESGSAQSPYCGGVPGDIREQRAPRKLADIYRLQRAYSRAESLLMQLLAKQPHDTLSWHTLGRVFLDSRQRVKLMAVIEKLNDCPQGNVFAAMLKALWHLNALEFAAAGTAIEQLVELAPLMPMPRILRVEWLTQTSAPITIRIQACRDLLRVQPGNNEARQLLANWEAIAAPVVQLPAHEASTSVGLAAVLPATAAISG